MYRKLPIALALVLAAILAAAPAAMAGQKVRGEMDLEYNLSWPALDLMSCPDWLGTITIGTQDYDMAFFAFGNGKPFDARPDQAEENSSAFFFEEIWEIYKLGTMVVEWDGGGIDCSTFERGDQLLVGYDRGLTNMKNSKYHMLGYVQSANGDFKGLEGRGVHMNGTINWNPDVTGNPPQYAPGTFRIN